MLSVTKPSESNTPKFVSRRRDCQGGSSYYCNYYDTYEDPKTGERTEKLAKKCDQNISSTESCVTYGVTPSDGKFFVSNLSANPNYSHTKVDAAGSILGTTQRMNSYGVAIAYQRDLGDWAYNLVVPLRHTDNNADYSALNNTQVGVVLAPTYHLFKEQVHGMTLDLGGLVGYNHTSFSNVNAVRDSAGAYRYTDFGNLNTAFASLNVLFSKELLADTRLALTARAIGYDNSGAGAMLGNTGNMLLASAGLSRQFSKDLLMNASVQAVRFNQNSFNTQSDYGNLALGANYRISNRASLALDVTQSVKANYLNITSANLAYKVELQ